MIGKPKIKNILKPEASQFRFLTKSFDSRAGNIVYDVNCMQFAQEWNGLLVMILICDFLSGKKIFKMM